LRALKPRQAAWHLNKGKRNILKQHDFPTKLRMAKLYKVRKKCLICGSIFYPRYAGSLYCETCKNKKSEPVVAKPAKAAKPAKKAKLSKKPAKSAKKPAKKAVKKASKSKKPKK
jgi:uncharacterized Zn finger protein (UPF0148 family)